VEALDSRVGVRRRGGNDRVAGHAAEAGAGEGVVCGFNELQRHKDPSFQRNERASQSDLVFGLSCSDLG
jgi:hypothetical protein